MNSNIRKAQFVQLEREKLGRFKYISKFNIVKALNKKLLSLKRVVNSLLQGIRLSIEKVDWELMRKEFFQWFFEVSIEGTILNFALYSLFNLPFTVMTALGYGILINEIISLNKRLKKDGPTTKILEK